MLAFATSAVRDASNGDEVLAHGRRPTGVELSVLSGADEARLTFLAVRRWYGWSSGRLLVLDIGGGSLEMAAGDDEAPDVAISLPLGAGRLTRGRFSSDPPAGLEVRALRKQVRAEIAEVVGSIGRAERPRHAVATSKTFRQLARITGAAPSSDGPFVRRELRPRRPAGLAAKLAAMTRGRARRRSRASARSGPRRSWPARSSRRRRWTCSTCRRSRSDPGRCARRSASAGLLRDGTGAMSRSMTQPMSREPLRAPMSPEPMSAESTADEPEQTSHRAP